MHGMQGKEEGDNEGDWGVSLQQVEEKSINQEYIG